MGYYTKGASTGSWGGGSSKPSGLRCWKCDQLGHIKRDCPNRVEHLQLQLQLGVSSVGSVTGSVTQLHNTKADGAVAVAVEKERTTHSHLVVWSMRTVQSRSLRSLLLVDVDTPVQCSQPSRSTRCMWTLRALST